MSEDISATLRTGITVILVAALIAVIINLMGMGTSILNNGQSTLQSGISNVTTQEFATYNNTNISGTQLTTCLNVFQDRDIGVVVVNAANPTTAYNYNKQLGGSNIASAAANTTPTITLGGTAAAGAAASATQLDMDSSKTFVLGTILPQASGGGSYRSYGNTAAVGNNEYINPSGRYATKLIKDSSGEIIGVMAIQYKNDGTLCHTFFN